MNRLDAWLTTDQRDPRCDDEGTMRCPACAAELGEPTIRTEDETAPCVGPVTITCAWTVEDRGVLDIIGWDHLGETYPLTLAPACGRDDCRGGHDVVMIAWVISRWTCRCGHVFELREP